MKSSVFGGGIASSAGESDATAEMRLSQSHFAVRAVPSIPGDLVRAARASFCSGVIARYAAGPSDAHQQDVAGADFGLLLAQGFPQILERDHLVGHEVERSARVVR